MRTLLLASLVCGCVAAPSDPRAAERERLVLEVADQGIRDTAVLRALATVPRHLFVPLAMAPYAYENRPLPIGHGQTISQPYIVALMTELARVRPGDTVLEVGTGSGYQAAVLAEVGATVHTIEIVEPLAAEAERRLARLGYGDSVFVRAGDGYRGWPEAAPFAAILVTAAPEEIPEPLLEQLAPGGRLVAPVGPENDVQELVVVTKREDGTLERRTVIPVRFVPMTGEAQERRRR